MDQKCLVVYASRTGNTEKVAQVFKKTFEKNGWQCDMFKIEKDTKPEELPYDYKDYDFVCAGAPVHNGLAVEEIITALRKVSSKKEIPHEKIVPGPKKGVVFATYSGAHLGPKEAGPALLQMALEMEHHKFECIGSFCCPGPMKMPGKDGRPPEMVPAPHVERSWHGDIADRPNERDLLRAKIFIEDKLEELAIRHPNQ